MTTGTPRFANESAREYPKSTPHLPTPRETVEHPTPSEYILSVPLKSRGVSRGTMVMSVAYHTHMGVSGKESTVVDTTLPAPGTGVVPGASPPTTKNCIKKNRSREPTLTTRMATTRSSPITPIPTLLSTFSPKDVINGNHGTQVKEKWWLR